MPSEFLPSAPSTNPETATLQLEQALRDLARPEGVANPKAYRPFLLQLFGQAWEAVAYGKPNDEVQESCERIERVRRILEEYIPTDLDPRTEAAIEILGAIRFLQAAIRVLANRALRRRPLQTNEQRILDSLRDAKTYLQRKDVHQQLERQHVKLSPPRVGQILSDLFHDGYLVRYQAPAQGGVTGFYALAPLGREVLLYQETGSTDSQARPELWESYERVTEAVAQRTGM
jgi:DNA-binding PadR family transcriptional regulator